MFASDKSGQDVDIDFSTKLEKIAILLIHADHIQVIQRSFSFSPGDYVLVNIPSLRFCKSSFQDTENNQWE